MHDFNNKFERFSYCNLFKHILKKLGYINPMVVQSMYIFKNGRVGGEVPPHTDNTFLRTKPSSCIGIWVALDDAKKDNGGMYAVPGSHKNPTNYFMKLKNENGRNTAVFDPLEKPEHNLTGAVPLEAEKGTVVLLHGDLVHFSHANYSNDQRHAYTIHVVESKNHLWEPDNWIQRSKNPFKQMNDVKF